MNWFTKFLYGLTTGELKSYCIFLIIIIILLIASIPGFMYVMKGG